jgi:hypothetical protein
MLGEAMTIKIKSWKMRLRDDDTRKIYWHRAVLESDWRKLMKLVKAADDFRGGDYWVELDAIVFARDALEKKK